VAYDLASLNANHREILLVHGGADGVDSLFDWAVKKNYPHWVIRVEPADWVKHGKIAGPIRNRLILDNYKPQLLLAYPDDESIGTWDMVRAARERKIDHLVRFYD
jgi:hypothetical protein